MNYNKKVLWIGFHEEGVRAFNKLLEKKVNVVGVITLKKKSLVKRSGAVNYLDLCANKGISVYEVDNINDDEAINIIKHINPDLTFVIGWSQILKPYVLDLLGFVAGAHASYLPKNRGSAPVNWSIINGDNESGNTLMKLSSSVDAGDIIFQEKFLITAFDSVKTIYQKVAVTNENMVLKAVDCFESNNIPLIKQNIGNGMILPRRKPKDGLIGWNQDSVKVYNFIRALTTPYPGAFTFYNKKKVIIWEVSLDYNNRSTAKEDIGNIVGIRHSFVPEQCGFDVQCRRGILTCHKIEAADTGEILNGELMIDFVNKEVCGNE